MASWYGGDFSNTEKVKKVSMTGNGVPEVTSSASLCDEHEPLLLETYCVEHDEVLCSACVSHYHMQCSGLLPLSEINMNSIKKKEMKLSVKELTDMKLKLSKVKQTKREELKMIECDTTKALKDIHEFRELINWALDRIERKGKEYVEKRHKEFSKQVKEDLEKCDEIIKAIDKRLKDASKGETKTESSKDFIELKKRKQVYKKASRYTENAKSNNVKEIVKFAIDPKVEQFARSLAWYGKDKTYLSFEPPLSFPHAYTVKGENQFDIRVKGDRSVCAAVDACQLRDGTLLIADASNRRLKQLDVLYQVVDFVDLHAEPTAVSVVNEDRAVVALAEGNDVTLQYVDTKMSLKLVDESFRLSEKCVGLACKDELIYVASANDIHEYSHSGEPTRKLYTVSGSTIQCMALNFDMSKIHLMDTSRGLVTIDMNGEEQGVSNDESFRGKCGIEADGNGQIFTCSHESHVVTQFNHDHSCQGVIVSNANGVKNPLGVTFDRLHTRLIVCMKSKNVIKVYDLK